MQKRPDLIVRKFTKERKRPNAEPFVQRFDFTTYSFIFDPPKDRPNLYKLCVYFQKLFLEGLDDVERTSVSSQRKIMQEIEPIKSDLIKFAQDADYERSEHHQHNVVENYLLYNDPKFIAKEIPLRNDEVSGFADGCRYLKETDRFEVVDFKPKAAAEKKAPTQLYWYRQLFHECTGIPLEMIDAVFFDDSNAYKLIF